MIDRIGYLKELINGVRSLNWSFGAVSGIIETTESDGIHGRTSFYPDAGREDEFRDNTPYVVDDTTLAEAKLAVVAVNMMPRLIAVAEAAIRLIDNASNTSSREIEQSGLDVAVEALGSAD